MNDLQTYCIIRYFAGQSLKVKIQVFKMQCLVSQSLTTALSTQNWTTVRPTVHTNIRHKNEALFLRLYLPSTLIPHQNRALFLQLDLPSTLICQENAALFLRLDRPSTLIRHENAALFLQLDLPSTLIRHENASLFLRLGLPSTLIRHENAALFLRLGLPSTLIRHENAALFLRLDPPSTLIRHENAALFLRLGLLTTLIRHENGALQTGGIQLKCWLFAGFSVDWKTDFPVQVSHERKSKMTGDCCVSREFLSWIVDEKHLMRFQRENVVFKFLRGKVDSA